MTLLKVPYKYINNIWTKELTITNVDLVEIIVYDKYLLDELFSLKFAEFLVVETFILISFILLVW